MITHVAFDFDGTLADSPHLVVELYNTIAQERGYGTLTPEMYTRLRDLTVRERSVALGVPMHKLPGLMVQVARAYRSITHRVTLHAGIPEVLRSLVEQDVRVCIVSTNNEDNIRSILRRYDLDPSITRVLCSNRIFGKARLLRRLITAEGIPLLNWYMSGTSDAT